MIPGKTLTPDDIWRALVRRRWFIILPFVAVLSAAGYYAQSLPNRYRSETLILVVPQRIPETYVRSTVTTRIEDRLRSINEQILSRSKLEPIIRDLGLYADARQRFPMEEVVAMMRDQITVATVRGDSFRLAFTSGDPVMAMKVTERLASMYIQENLRDREVQAEGTNAFLESQLESARQRLMEHEEKLETYRRQYSGELPSQLQSNLSAIQSQRQAQQAISESINRDRDRRLMLERSLTDLSAAPEDRVTPKTDAADISTDQKLDAARESLRAALARLKPDHPDVLAAQRLVARLEQELAGQPVEGVAPKPTSDAIRRVRAKQLQTEIDAVDRQIAAKEADAARLKKQIDEYQRRVDAAPSRETEMTELMRDYKTLQDMYTSLLAKKEDSKLSANLERAQAGEQFKILDPARVPEKPFSPNRPQILAFGAVIGLAIGVGLSMLLEFRDTSIRSDDEVVRILALPVLAMVPYVSTRFDVRRRRRRVAAVAIALVVAAGLTGAGVAWKLGMLG
jgi:polysaccharide chain length determinant protein (PEP-CTERM system associated)